MRVRDERVPEELYGSFVSRMPQVCVELVIEHPEGLLLAERTKEPAAGKWFWPGSRLYKGERLADGAHRVAREELGIEIVLHERLGVYAHFWETSDVAGHPSRHTVNVVFRATPVADHPRITLDDQHSAYRFLDELEPGLHEYVRRYVEDGALL